MLLKYTPNQNSLVSVYSSHKNISIKKLPSSNHIELKLTKWNNKKWFESA